MSTAKKHTDLLTQITKDKNLGGTHVLCARRTLEWLDERPGQVPGRTITESELEGVNEWLPDTAQIDSPTRRDVAEFFSHTVVPDPEPTDAEKATGDLEVWGITRAKALELGAWLAGQGWVKKDVESNE